MSVRRHGHRAQSIARRGRAPHPAVAAALAVAATLALAGCDALGNPEPMLETPPARWVGPGVALLTRTRSVPATRSGELSRQVPGGRFEHVDTEARPGDVVVLVEVEVVWARRPAVRAIPLVTRFELADGRKLQRTWAARADLSTWYAGFAMPGAPVAAVTLLGP